MLEKIKNMDSRKRILLICYAVIAVCLVVLAVYGAKWIKQRNNIKEVQKIAKVEEEGNEKLDFAKLQEINPDIYAWIYIPGTKVNYPVLQSSEEEYEDYVAMLKTAISYYEEKDSEKYQTCVGELLQVEDMLAEVKDSTHSLAYQINDKPELELSKETVTYINSFR